MPLSFKLGKFLVAFVVFVVATTPVYCRVAPPVLAAFAVVVFTLSCRRLLRRRYCYLTPLVVIACCR